MSDLPSLIASVQNVGEPLNSTSTSSDVWDDVGKIGVLSGRGNITTAIAKLVAIIICNLAGAGADTLCEDSVLSSAKSPRRDPTFFCGSVKRRRFAKLYRQFFPTRQTKLNYFPRFRANRANCFPEKPRNVKVDHLRHHTLHHLLHRREFTSGQLITSDATGKPGSFADVYFLEHCPMGAIASGANQKRRPGQIRARGSWQLACIERDGFGNIVTGGKHEW